MPSAMTPRLPAWKRLGLKLKFAQETPEAQSANIEGDQDLGSPKRKRTSRSEDSSAKKKVTKTTQNLSPDIVSTPNIITKSTPTLNKKKSVTFTPETKVDDGDSIKQLFNAWVADQKAQDPSFRVNKSSGVFDTPEPSHVEEQIDTTLSESERRMNRIRKTKLEKGKSKTASKSTIVKPAKTSKPSSSSPRPFLAYLRHYHDSRDTWKFNKNYQNNLLKHAFDVEAIPSEYTHLLYEYIRGIQGGVRIRLRDSALAVKVQDQEQSVSGFPENMEHANKRQLEYNVAMKEYVATMTANGAASKMGYEEGVLLGLSDAAMCKRVAKRMRAEQILAELGTNEEEQEETGSVAGGLGVSGDDDSQKRLRMNDGSTQKVTRKRKQRTMTAEDDSSSSEESTDSDDSSDESASGRGKESSDDSTSSSSSSSSESESQSESESESDSEGESDETEESDSD